jgi:rsbT co-antagonist protein RsbR
VLTTRQTSAVSDQLFTAEEQEALRLLWDVYDRHYDEILAVTMAAAEADPALKQILSQVPAKQLEADQLRSRRLTESAMRNGDWQPLLDDTKQQGVNYARMGLPFRSWFPIATAFQKPLVEKLFEAYAADSRRLQAILLVLNRWLFDVALAGIGEMYLDTREHVIRQQQEAIASQAQEILEIATPVVRVWDGIILAPIIGSLDSQRTQQLMERLLQGIVDTGSSVALVDITGVPAVDTQTARHLVESVAAVRLIGADVILTGVRPAIAQTLVHLGVDLAGITTRASLAAGLRAALETLNLHVAATT